MVLQRVQRNYKKKVEKLSDEAIKDIWVRKKCYNSKREHHREFKPGIFIQSDEHDKIVSQLTAGDENGNLYNFLNEHVIGLQERREINQSDKSREEWVFDEFTKDKFSEEKLIKEARKSLMVTVEGVGMPLSNIVKDSIDSWAETEEVEI